MVAVRPNLDGWLQRRHGALGFRTTQVLTDHGCFGKYLCRIGREPTPGCHHCSAPEDTALHTLAVCPAWSSQRRSLVSATGADPASLESIVLSMVQSEEAWAAVASFCEEVMAVKESAEREREATTALLCRSRRTRRRRAPRDDLQPP